jgi:hypothetical protein
LIGKKSYANQVGHVQNDLFKTTSWWNLTKFQNEWFLVLLFNKKKSWILVLMYLRHIGWCASSPSLLGKTCYELLRGIGVALLVIGVLSPSFSIWPLNSDLSHNHAWISCNFILTFLSQKPNCPKNASYSLNSFSVFIELQNHCRRTSIPYLFSTIPASSSPSHL